MPFGGWFKGRQKSVASATAFSVATAGFLVAAFQSDGVHAADLALNDGGVWVTKPAAGEGGYVGRVNAALKSLDARVSVKGVADVSQVGSSVLVLGGSPTFIDPVTMAMAGAIELDKPSVVAHGGGGPLTSGLTAPAVVAIVDSDGKAWVLPAEQAAINTKTTKPIKDVDLGEGASAVVGDDGAAHLVSVDDRTVLTYPPRAGGPGEPQRRSLPGPDNGLGGDEVSVTAVGTTPVVLAGDRLLVADGPEIDVAGLGDDPVLQQPGPPSDGVVVATADGLYSVPLNGAEPRKVADVAADRPAAPVWAQGCVYAVWSGGSQPYASRCGDDEARTGTVPDSVGNELVLRENRGLVVIQGMDTGNATLPFEGDLVIDDWEAASPPEPIEQEKGDTSRDQTTRREERAEIQQKPPIAREDQLGARVGRATVLPVLLNDSDPNGDALAVTEVSAPTSGAEVDIVGGGAAVQLRAAEAPGDISFTYTVTDGRGGKATADVTVSVAQLNGPNEPPQIRTVDGDDYVQATTVAVGQTVQYNVVGDWIDNEGDPLTLVGATSPNAEDIVRTAPDGTLAVTVAQPTGTRRVSYTISDGYSGDEVTGALNVKVIDPSQVAAPTARADLVTATAGVPVRIRPLVNDTDPNGDRLSLVDVGEAVEDGRPAKVEQLVDEAAGVITVTFDKPGTYRIPYAISDSTAATSGADKLVTSSVRVQVVSPDGENSPPVAVTDVAVVPTNGEPVLLDLLANDSDLDGDILVVPSVNPPPDDVAGKLVTSLESQQVLVLSTDEPFDDDILLTYTVSDGEEATDGQVLVQTVQPPARNQAPVVVDDTAVVRAGQIVDIPVLLNDRDPDGDEIRLLPEVELSGEGNVVVSDTILRYQAPMAEQDSDVEISYTAIDSFGRKASAVAKVEVNAIRDPDDNRAPQPVDVEVRLLSLQEKDRAPVPISIPLWGIDPDGDMVQVTGVGFEAEQGLPGFTDEDGKVTFTVWARSRGTDEFTYTVTDAYGQTGEGRVRVGIAPAGDNQYPVAVDDTVTVAPDRALRVKVLENDNDPDGDTDVAFDPSFTAQPQGEVDVTVEIDGRDLLVSKPEGDVDAEPPPVVTIPYSIRDSGGLQDQATLQITYDDEALPIPPVAVDDEAPEGSDAEVTVDVLANDSDLDHPDPADWTLEPIDDQPVDMRVEGDNLVIQRADETVYVGYRVTDPDGAVGGAFVRVPGRQANQAPVPSGGGTFDVTAGESVLLDLTEFATDPEGDAVRLSGEEGVSRAAKGTFTATGPAELRYEANPDARGEDQVRVTVVDAPEDGRPPQSAVITLVARIEPTTDNEPPTIAKGVRLKVENGRASGTTLDLASYASDPDGDDLEFSLVKNSASGVDVDVTASGQVLATAPPNTKPGGERSITVRVSDGEADSEVVIPVEITKSGAPPLQVKDFSEAKAVVGDTYTFDVLKGAFNPAAPAPLTVEGTALEVGSGQVRNDTTSVTVTPTEVGQTRVRFTVQDAFGEPDRARTGVISMTVRTVPDPVRGLTAKPVPGGGAVELSWGQEPFDGGAPITGYVVNVNGGPGSGARSITSAQTRYVVDGLANGTVYSFTVQAENEVGPSKSSSRASAKPDRIPDPAADLRLRYETGTERQLVLTWREPKGDNPGTPVQQRDVTLSSPGGVIPGACKSAQASSQRCVFTGLTNGAQYTARVVLTNAAGPSEPSTSNTEIPYGRPSQPGRPQARDKGESVVNGETAIVTFAGSADNGGDPNIQYRVRISPGGQEKTGRPGQEIEFGGLTNGQTYSFTVTAKNASGLDATSEPSAGVLVFGAPSAVQITGRKEEDRRVVLNYSIASTGGRPISQVYVYQGGGGTPVVTGGGGTSGSITVPNLNNGASYSFQMAASNGKQGPRGNTMTASPFGRPDPPTVTFTGANGLDVNFSFRSNFDGGRPITAIKRRIDSGGWTTVRTSPGSGNYIWPAPDGGRRATFTVQVCNAAGLCSEASAAGTAEPRRVTISKGGVPPTSFCSHSSCRYVNVDVRNFPRNTSVRFQPSDSAAGTNGWPATSRTTNDSGSYDLDNYYYFGFPGRTVWVTVDGTRSNSIAW